MAWVDRDTSVRAAAFAWIADQVRQHGSEVLPRPLLAAGFDFEGTRVPIIGPQGIFKPAALPEVPLSILTVPRVEGKEAPYEDGWTEDGFVYRYRGTDPHHPDNVGEGLALVGQVPTNASTSNLPMKRVPPITTTFIGAPGHQNATAGSWSFLPSQRVFHTIQLLVVIFQAQMRDRVLTAHPNAGCSSASSTG